MHVKQRCRKQSCTSLSQQELFAGFAYQIVRTPSLQSFVLKRSAVLSRPVLFATAFMSLFSLVIAFCKVRREGGCEKASSEGLSNDHGPFACSRIFTLLQPNSALCRSGCSILASISGHLDHFMEGCIRCWCLLCKACAIFGSEASDANVLEEVLLFFGAVEFEGAW